MRVITGRLGGRVFSSPRGHRTHPMSDKARGALFNVLGDIERMSVLDAFAGSGALSIEAISRGALNATAIDVDKDAVKIMHENAAQLGLAERIKVVRANVSGWSDNNPGMQFDLVLCDPPYDQLQEKLLQKLTKHLKTGGTYVLSWPGNLKPLSLENLGLVHHKSYGDNQLFFYKTL